MNNTFNRPFACRDRQFNRKFWRWSIIALILLVFVNSMLNLISMFDRRGLHETDERREQQLETRAEIIAVAIVSRLERNRDLSCDEVERIRALWEPAGFDRAKRWDEIKVRECAE